jgi:hypothetical protein
MDRDAERARPTAINTEITERPVSCSRSASPTSSAPASKVEQFCMVNRGYSMSGKPPWHLNPNTILSILDVNGGSNCRSQADAAPFRAA